jgi:hypothetical protein
VGGMDMPVIEIKTAYDELHCIKEMKIITGASHLFEEQENCQRSLILRLPGIKKIWSIKRSIIKFNQHYKSHRGFFCY